MSFCGNWRPRNGGLLCIYYLGRGVGLLFISVLLGLRINSVFMLDYSLDFCGGSVGGQVVCYLDFNIY
jgi:hypothetical protein